MAQLDELDAEMPRPGEAIIFDLARALARQAAREDAAVELAKQRTASCELPSTPVSVPTFKTSGQ